LTHSRRSPNRRVIRPWLIERNFKLALSSDVQHEYLRIFQDLLGFDKNRLEKWRRKFGDKRVAESIGVGTSLLSRDPKDNVFIATATAAKAKFLVTNDRGLLDISEQDKGQGQWGSVQAERLQSISSTGRLLEP